MRSKYQVEKDAIATRIAELEARVADLQATLESLERLETPGFLDGLGDTARRPNSAMKALPPPPSIVAELTWPEAVDYVLKTHPDGLTVREMVSELQRNGRKFPPGRLDIPIRGVLRRRAEAMDWEQKGNRWTKRQEATP